MRVRMRIDVSGTFHNIDSGVKVGDIVDVDEASAERYIRNGYAEKVDGENFSDKEFTDQLKSEESAVLNTVVETATVKRRGRPRKQPEWHDDKAPGWSEGNPQS